MHRDQDAEVVALITRLNVVGFRDAHRKLNDCFTQITLMGAERRSCDQWFCASCRVRRRARRVKKHYDTLRLHHEARGSAWFITLTRPAQEPVGDQLRAVHLFFQRLMRKAQWRGSKRIPAWSQTLSIFLAFELGHGDRRPGLIHAHLLILGPALEARDASRWMIAAWLAHFPSASPEAQDRQLLLGFAAWLDRFNYLAKGSALNSAWSEADFVEVLMAMGGFAKPFRSFGVARAKSKIRKDPKKQQTQVA